jgi:glycosyltransferase involved in cell wall biosynthesis
MSKKSLVLQGPVMSRSGYGDHAKDIAYAFIKSGKYDVTIVPTMWGGTSMDNLEDNNEKDIAVKNCIATDTITERPDIFVQVSIPNEFNPIGKYCNIGITAGIETTQCAPEWLVGMNKMDFNIVPSKFAKQVFDETKYEVKDKNTNNTTGMLSIEKPIEVLFEGIDTDVFFKSDESDADIDNIMESVQEDFAFLCVGHWLNGDFGEDRKNISGLIHTFINTFKGESVKPALILKTSGATFSIRDRSRIVEKINAIKSMFKSEDIPSIYLIHGNLTRKQMNCLYNHSKVKAMVSFTKGEGFGRPLLEFSATGKPVIASNFSGHLDFLNPVFHVMLPGELKEIHRSAVWDGILVQGSSWFTVDYKVASSILSDVFKSYKKYSYESKKFLQHVHKWSLNAMADKLESIMGSIVIPEKIELKMPNLNLPQLKKVE